VPPDAVPDPEVAQLIKDVVATTGGARDAGGADGVGQPELDRFLERARAWLAWRAREREAAVWGEATAEAVALVGALDAKIEEYFWTCDLLRLEGRSARDLRLDDAELRALRAAEAAALEAHLARAPLAEPTPSGALSEVVNPVYRDRFAELREKVLARALDGASGVAVAALGPPAARELTRESWRRVKARFDGWHAWRGDRPAEDFEQLGEERVRAIVDGPLAARLGEFIATDKAAAEGLEHAAELEKLLLLQRWLVDLANNFVNFSSIYQPDQVALVEMGSLVIDGRRLDFCLRIDDRAAHKKIAAESLIFLVYAEVTAKDASAPAFEVVAPVTSGERGRLRIGKRGLFIDLDGKEWDARVVDLLENPISVKEATLAPFRRVSQFVSKKLEDWIGTQQAAREKQLVSRVDQHVTEGQKRGEAAARELEQQPPVDAPKLPAPAAPPPAAAEPAASREAKGLDVNSLILGGGIALGGIAAVLGAVFGLLATLKGWAAVGGVAVAVLALSALVGWLKLRRRDMSLILEASGWALNVHMKLNRRIGRVFTYTPALPAGSVKDRFDLLATDEDRHPWRRALLVALAVIAVLGALAWYYVRERGVPTFLRWD
jgi:hypothetical protein